MNEIKEFLNNTFQELNKLGITKEEAQNGFDYTYRRLAPSEGEPHSDWWPIVKIENNDVVPIFEELKKNGIEERDIADAIQTNWNISPVIHFPAFRKGELVDLINGIVKLIHYDRGDYAECNLDNWTYFLPIERGDRRKILERIQRHISEAHGN